MEFKPNTIYCGDCKEILDCLPPNCVDLIYIDPPFFTSQNYEIVFRDGYELRGFRDAHWYQENKRREDIYVYLDWLRERVERCYRVLKDTGSFYLHCDWHANAYIRVYVLDPIFGFKNFRNELIWLYTRPGTKHERQFPRTHDVIFWYSKSGGWKFNVNGVRIPYAENTVKRGKYSVKTSKVTKGIKRRILPAKGKCPEDWWHIPMIQGNANERLGYPTQKPEKLLERIIKASSSEGDVILDPMGGCGSAIAVAQKLGRSWIGIDISPTGCRLIRDRVSKLMAGPPEIIGLPMTVEALKAISWEEFQNWICRECFQGSVSARKHHDMGIDGYSFLENAPIQIKQSERIGRSEIDRFEGVLGRYYAGSRKGKKGYMVAFSFTSGAYDEAKRAKLESEITIELKTVDELLM